MIKKLRKILLNLIIGVVAGGATFLGLEFFDNGGTIEGFKVYLMDTVVPSVVNIMAILSTIYIGAQPYLNNITGASNGLLQAKELIGSVSEENKATNSVVNEIAGKLFALVAQNEALNEESKKQQARIDALEADIKVTQQMIATGFGNMPELVKSGNARVIYGLMEGNKDETEG
jgi:hypothetical protein